MSRALIIELERCGIGRDDGPPPSIRCGWFRVFFFPKSMAAVLKDYEASLTASREAVRTALGRVRPQDTPVSVSRSCPDPVEAELSDEVRRLLTDRASS